MSRADRDYLQLHGLHYLFDQLAKELAEARPKKPASFTKAWLLHKGDAARQTELAESAIRDVNESITTGAPTAGAGDSDKALAAIDSCVASVARAQAGLPPHHPSRAELVRLRTRLADDRRIILKWRQSYPKEADGSIRLPGGESMQYRAATLKIGDFPVLQLQEDDDEHVSVFYLLGKEKKRLQAFDEDEELKDIDFDCVKEAQSYVLSILHKMGCAADANTQAAADTWEELMRWIGADKHVAGILRIHVP
eukprot:TRINITY_DN4131_c0_g7_i1.p2 TRINITY_DN4131_c0_g7~~TRINITY_DN4131_c0_g7_i1.p2  ORF type:complete len:272 (+),score=105.49 TRINITY_DN4131_c0_g7_i1:63-818(+)